VMQRLQHAIGLRWICFRHRILMQHRRERHRSERTSGMP
jgi:hypothetical protein